MAKILVIDDDPSVRASLEQALKSADHSVALAVNGLDGMKQHGTQPADLILVDLFMPTQDGVETIIQLRKLEPNVRIIAISGNVLSSTVLPVAQKLGAVAVLEKPFAVDQLLKTVDNALASKKRG